MFLEEDSEATIKCLSYQLFWVCFGLVEYFTLL